MFDAETRAAIGAAAIPHGGDWKGDIDAAVKRASCVLVFWSKEAIAGQREQFHYELYRGLREGKLFQCVIDDLPTRNLPCPYKFIQTANLRNFNSREASPDLVRLSMEMVSRRVKRTWRERLFGAN